MSDELLTLDAIIDNLENGRYYNDQGPLDTDESFKQLKDFQQRRTRIATPPRFRAVENHKIVFNVFWWVAFLSLIIVIVAGLWLFWTAVS